MSQQRTYWHLLDLKRLPTEYELVTSRLHYYLPSGFEVDVPLSGWYRQYQQGSPLACSDWELFRDPRQTTYTSYTRLQRDREVYVDGLLQSIESTDYDRTLPDAWVRLLARVFAPLVYPFHGFQMIASYVGAMGPGGRITIAALFQAADEIRRVQRIAYRVRQLQLTYPGFGDDRRSLWQEDPIWQPLREATEKLLVTYDWGEAFVGLNLVLKPMIDELLMSRFGSLALREGDYILKEILACLFQDCDWHRQWSRALVGTAVEDRPQNSSVIQGWVDKWTPLTAQAVAALAGALERATDGPTAPEVAEGPGQPGNLYE